MPKNDSVLRRYMHPDRAAHKARANGFLLLEVMLSVFIVSVGIVFVIASFATTLQVYKISRDYTELLFIVDEVMWPYRERGRAEVGHDSGELELYDDSGWEIDVREDDDMEMNVLHCRVQRHASSGGRYFSVTTYVHAEE